MFRGVSVTLALVIAAMEPALSVGEGDLVKYAVTQGGLLLVVLVLLWNARNSYEQRLGHKEESNRVLIDLVSDTRVALAKNADTILTQAESIKGLTRAVEKITERRS